jgi:hypothetical protein
MELYQAAVVVADADEGSAAWLGAELHNQDKNASSAEAYAFASLLNPSDAGNLSHLADELSICLAARDTPIKTPPALVLPDGIGGTEVAGIVHCSMSCSNVDAEVSDRVRRALGRIDVEVQGFDEPLTRAEKVAHVKRIYLALRSPLTTPGIPYESPAQPGAAAEGAER